jgi:hypothetical protein
MKMTRIEAIKWIADQMFEAPSRDPLKGGLALSALGVTPAEYAEATGAVTERMNAGRDD